MNYKLSLINLFLKCFLRISILGIFLVSSCNLIQKDFNFIFLFIYSNTHRQLVNSNTNKVSLFCVYCKYIFHLVLLYSFINIVLFFPIFSFCFSSSLSILPCFLHLIYLDKKLVEYTITLFK